MEEKLGFGAVEGCQAAIGITCSECRYRDACLEHDVENVSLGSVDLCDEEEVEEMRWAEGLI